MGDPVSRKPGVDVLLGRFPHARPLWVAEMPSKGFSVGAYQISGYVVLLQQFDGQRGFGWDVYVPASDSNKIADVLDAVETRVRQEVAP